MSSAQATAFAATYAVVEQYSAPLGFSATLFQKGTQKYLAIRGTEGSNYGVDFFVDFGVFTGTGAVDQYSALETWYQQLLATGKVSASEQMIVSGHSLGGFLAQGFSVDYPNAVSQTYTYNAPGLGGLVAEIFQALGWAQPIVPLNGITNIRAEPGLSATASLGTVLGNIQPIFIEASLDPVHNHSIATLTDSLALYAQLAAIDPTLDNATSGIQTITGILKSASNAADSSLESTLDSLRELFDPASTTPTTTGDREAYYTNLAQLQQYAGSAQITSLASKTATEIVSLAQSDIAYRYALNQLNPFAVTGNDNLYAAHNAGGELDLYHAASGTGSLTERYLSDRADMLAWKIQYDTTDHAYTPDWNTDSVSGDWDYIDQGTLVDGAPLQLSIDGKGVTLFTDHQIVFGDNGANVLTGSGDSDRLYGGAGADTLTGNAGADYLEGGTGSDTYHINPGDGNDTILDTDGQGSIVYNGRALTGGTQISSNYWRGANGVSYSLLTTGGSQDLLIDTGTDRLTVKDFAPGELGISLPGGSAPPSGQTATGFNIYGDLTPYQMPWDYYLWLAYPTWPYLFDVNGNLVHSTVPMPYFADKIFDSSGDDNIYAGHGLNVIYAMKGGNNYIESGANDDYIVGGNGRDVVFSGGMSDTIDVAGGNDIVYGADGGDVAEGGAGNDYLVGGSGDDTMQGTNVADRIDGGAGNDQIFGGAPLAWQDAVGTVPILQRATRRAAVVNDCEWRCVA